MLYSCTHMATVGVKGLITVCHWLDLTMTHHSFLCKLCFGFRADDFLLLFAHLYVSCIIK